jgi:hypothetical protein
MTRPGIQWNRCVVSFDQVIDEHASPALLYFYQPVLHEHLRIIIEDQSQSCSSELNHLGILLQVAGHFTKNYARFWSFEVPLSY